MNRKAAYPVLSTCLLGMVLVGHCWSQTSSPTLIITKILEYSGDEAKKIPGPTSKVEIRRAEATPWDPARITSKLFVQNQLKIAKQVSVGLFIQEGDHHGRFTCLTDTLNEKGKSVEIAQFEITRDNTHPANVAIRILTGAAIAENKSGDKKGRFSILAGDLLTVMGVSSTTQALYVVYPDTTGFIYYLDGKPGAISFPDSASFPDSVKMKQYLKKGQVARFKGDQVVQIGLPELIGGITLSSALLETFSKNNIDKVWAKPWWQQPRFYIPATAAVLSVGTGLILQKGPQNRLPGPPGLPGDH